MYLPWHLEFRLIRSAAVSYILSGKRLSLPSICVYFQTSGESARQKDAMLYEQHRLQVSESSTPSKQITHAQSSVYDEQDERFLGRSIVP